MQVLSYYWSKVFFSIKKQFFFSFSLFDEEKVEKNTMQT